MIKPLKRLRYLVVCGLYIPFSAVTGLVWFSTGTLVSYVSLIYLPFEYVITGEDNFSSSLIFFWWNKLPIMYEKQSKYFFNSIHPE